MEEMDEIAKMVSNYDSMTAGSEPKDPLNVLELKLEKLQMEKSLIALVGKQGALYNSRHPRFKDDSYKEELWQGIANQLSMDLTKCLSCWAELRYAYQKHVRRLRIYRRAIVQRCGISRPLKIRRRPVMLHEEDMIFLYEHVAKLPLKRFHSKEVVESVENDEEDKVSTASAVTEIIDVDLVDDKEVNDFHFTNDHRRLIEAVKSYPQLYDVLRPTYDNYRHRGLIWGSISNELRDKATKLMKRWLYLQTRYEWELSRTEGGVKNSELWNELSFLAPHIHQMPNTVCKWSLYLQNGWFDPIEHFRTVTTLINTIKSMPELIRLVDLNIPVTQKLPEYHELWEKVASAVKCSYQRCEVTWLTVRCFHQELTEMRKAGYLLQDKWYFENVIGAMYKQVLAQPTATKSNGGTTPMATLSMLTSPLNNPMPTVNPTRLPLAIVYPPTTKKLMDKANTATSSTVRTSPLDSPMATVNPPRLPLAIVYPPTTKELSTTGSNISSVAVSLATNPNITISKILPSVNMMPTSVTSSLTTNATSDISAPIISSSSAFVNSTISISTSSALKPALIASKMAPPAFVGMPLIQMPSTSNAIQSATRPPVQVLLRPLANATTAPPALAPLANAPVAIIRGVPVPANPPVTTVTTAGIQNVATVLRPALPRMPKLVPIAIRSDKVTIPKLSPLTSTSATTTTMSATTSSKSNESAKSATPPQVTVHENALSSYWDPIPVPTVFTVAPSAPATQLAICKETQSSQTKNVVDVELVDNQDGGNSLHVWNNSFHYHLNMTRTALFIREIMAIPQIHTKNPQVASKCVEFWQQISKKFHMPEIACRATWSFLHENMSLFPHIAPMAELMRPFKTSLKVWEKSHRLFSKFDEIARKYQWMIHKDKLPALMQHFQRYEHLYWELRKPRPGEPITAPRQYSDQVRLEVWRTAREKFPNMNHRDIWSMFKFAFRTYMEDLERGIENPWPQNWWQALEQLKFLIEVRYHPLEPYYYIVHNKFLEEVKRCSIYESLMSGSSEKSTTVSTVVSKKVKTVMPWESEEAKRLLTGQLSTSKPVNNIELPPKPIIHAPVVPVDGILDPRRERHPAAEDLVQHMERTSRPLPTISSFQLTCVLRRHPHTFEKATTLEKRTAWVKVAKELNTTVTECRLSLQHALRELRILKFRDPSCRCILGHKYYRHMGEIYRQVKPHTTINVRSDANSDLRETLYPERYIPEINMITCKPRLVLKNLAYAMSSFSLLTQDDLKSKLKLIFARYAEESHITWPMEAATAKRKSDDGNSNINKNFTKRLKTDTIP